MKPIRVIEVLQPHATILSVGGLQYCVRRYGLNYTGPVAIYASSYWNEDQDRYCRLPTVRVCLKAFGYDKKSDFAFGKVVALANLESCDMIHDTEDYCRINQIKGMDSDLTKFTRGDWAYCFSTVSPIDYKPKHIGRFQWKMDHHESIAVLGLVDKTIPIWGNGIDRSLVSDRIE